MHDIYNVIDVSRFQFNVRILPFDWRLLHGIDVDEVVFKNDTAALEQLVPTLQQGSIEAEPGLPQQHCIQLFRLVQLSVEHLWHMRECHSKLYPVYVQAHAAAVSWKAAADNYLRLGARLLQQLQSDSGALLTEQVLSEVAAAREALEKVDAEYNTALDRLEVEDKVARCHALRRQRLNISWRLVFEVDMQQLVASGNVAQLEQLLPQVAYGNILAEDPASLTRRHFRQLVLLGQACLDYLWAICMATSKVMDKQVQQLATASTPIPELTTSTEELRAALATALAGSMQLVQPWSPCTAAAATAAAPQQQHSCTHIRSSSPCHAYSVRACSPGHLCCTSAVHNVTTCCPMHGCASRHCCGQCLSSTTVVCSGTAGGLLSSVLLPTAGNLKAKMDQLEGNLRIERTKTEAMRRTLEEATALLEQLPLGQQQQQQQQQPLQQPPLRPVLVSAPASRPDTPTGAVRVVIDEEKIREQERQAASHQLSQHINDIVSQHEFTRKLRLSHSRHVSSGGGGAKSPSIQFTSVPSDSAAAAAFGSLAGGSSRLTTRSSAGFAANMQVAAAAVKAAGGVAASAAEAAAAADLQASQEAEERRKEHIKQRLSLVPVFGLPGLVSPGQVGMQAGLPEKVARQSQPAAADREQAAAEGLAVEAAAGLYKQAGLLAAAAGQRREKQLQQQSNSPGASRVVSKVKELARSVSPKRMFGSYSGDGSSSTSKPSGFLLPAGPAAEGAASCSDMVPEFAQCGVKVQAPVHVVVSPRVLESTGDGKQSGNMSPVLQVAGSSFSSSVAAKAAAELIDALAPGRNAGRRSVTPSEVAQLSPLIASIVLAQQQ